MGRLPDDEPGPNERAGADRDLDSDPFDEPDEADSSPGFHTALPPRVEAWRKRSATGAILTGFALGLQEVLEPKREEPAIVMQTSGDPPRDLPVEADFEHLRPRQSVVTLRPWLFAGDTVPGEADGHPPGKASPQAHAGGAPAGGRTDAPGAGAGAPDDTPAPGPEQA
ncbi:MAG: hypothetical protein ACREC5_08420 [Thermoplasmata archaeon]